MFVYIYKNIQNYKWLSLHIFLLYFPILSSLFHILDLFRAWYMCKFIHNFIILLNLRKYCTYLHFRKVQSSSALLQNLARTPGMYMMPSKLAQKCLKPVYKIGCSSVGYIKQPFSLYVLLHKHSCIDKSW